MINFERLKHINVQVAKLSKGILLAKPLPSDQY